MKTADAIQSIQDNTKAIKEMVKSINKTLEKINDTNVLHAQMLERHIGIINNISHNLDKTNSYIQKTNEDFAIPMTGVIATNKVLIGIVRWAIIAVIVALIALAGAEKVGKWLLM